MAKSIFLLNDIGKITIKANYLYLTVLAAFDDNSIASMKLHELAESVRRNKRSVAGFNLCKEFDSRIFQVLLQTGNTIQGVQNKEIRKLLTEIYSSSVSRIFLRLRLPHIIRKVPSRKRYTITDLGITTCAEALKFIHLHLEPA